MERKSKSEADSVGKTSSSKSDRSSETERTLKMESLLKKVLVENQRLKSAVTLLRQQSKEKDNYEAEDCKRSKEKLLTEIGSLLTEIAFLKEVREQLRFTDPEARKETTKALTETIQAKLEVAHAKIEAAEAKKETLEAQRRAEEAKESAEAAQAREDTLLSYVSRIATLAYQQAAEAEHGCAQAQRAMVPAEGEGRARRSHKPHRGHRGHGECRCHHHHHHHRGHHELRSDAGTQSEPMHSEPETLSSTR